jgi:DASH complex subunit SPC19
MAEIAPEVSRLLSKVEGYLGKMERRERALIARGDLLSGRLSMGGAGGKTRRVASGGATRGQKPGQAALEERMRVMRGKKERLGYAIERLVLKGGQRERQLRQSIAHQ